MQVGIVAHPAWYPGLSQASSFEEFQASLFEHSNHDCPAPCQPAPEGQCHTAAEGEECFRHTTWAMNTGTTVFPPWYPAALLKGASFEDFQAWLHQIHHGSCPRPCTATSDPPTPAPEPTPVPEPMPEPTLEPTLEPMPEP